MTMQLRVNMAEQASIWYEIDVLHTARRQVLLENAVKSSKTAELRVAGKA